MGRKTESKPESHQIIPSWPVQSHQDFLHLHLLLTIMDLRLLMLHEVSAHAADTVLCCSILKAGKQNGITENMVALYLEH